MYEYVSMSDAIKQIDVKDWTSNTYDRMVYKKDRTWI